MKRKVVQIAGFTKVVSLPAEWVKENGVQKGEEVDVKNNGKTILISTVKSDNEIKRAHLDVSGFDDVIVWPVLSLLHKTGYDEIKVSGINGEMMRIIHDRVTSSLFGFEVIEQTKEHCIIKNIAEGSSMNFQSILRKIFLVTLSEARQALEFIETSSNHIEEIDKLEETNNKLTNYCQRTLNEDSMTIQNRYEYFIVWILESIGDGYKYLCREINKNKKSKVSKDIIELIKSVNELLELFYDIYYKFSLEKFSALVQKQNELNEKVTEFLREKKGLNSVVLIHLNYIVQTIHDSNGALLNLKADLDDKLK